MCRRELSEESSRQHLQFQEQMQRLKVQSEERLQARLGHLKVTEEEVTHWNGGTLPFIGRFYPYI